MRLLLTILGTIGFLGCSSSQKPLDRPSYSPSAAGAAAITEYDTNKNGTIEGAELDACPSLKYALDRIDTNKDKALSADEIATRLQSYISAQIAAVGTTVTVILDGSPMSGANVTLVPEKFMMEAVGSSTGTTDKTGAASITLSDGKAPG
ncbi:MAG: hypothetical protein ACRCZF_18070, partial [Gemmataceae bacterium]